MVTDKEGIKFLINLEAPNGFSPTWYIDGNSKSIGYGHLYVPGVDNFDQVNAEEAMNLLVQDLKIAEKKINDAIQVPLNQNQFNALVSFAYNTGRKTSDLYNLINNKSSTENIGNWWTSHYLTSNGVFLSGLKKRRLIEFNLFKSGGFGIMEPNKNMIAFLFLIGSMLYFYRS
jgi:lysozyme